MNLVVNEGDSLGLMIRGGKEFGLGIYLTGVDAYSVAEDAGLKVYSFIEYVASFKSDNAPTRAVLFLLFDSIIRHIFLLYKTSRLT